RTLGTRRSRKIISRNITTPLEGSVAGRIYFGRRNPRATGKTSRAIPLSHSHPRRSDHAPQPPGARNARQVTLPRRRYRYRRCRSLSVAVIGETNARRVLALRGYTLRRLM